MSNPNDQSVAPYGVQSYMPQTGFNSPQYNGSYDGASWADLNEWRNRANAAITGLGSASLTFGQAATTVGTAANKLGTTIQGYGYK